MIIDIIGTKYIKKLNNKHRTRLYINKILLIIKIFNYKGLKDYGTYKRTKNKAESDY